MSVDINDYDPVAAAKEVCLERLKKDNPEAYKLYLEGQKPAKKPLAKMNKSELLAEAQERGIEVNPEATNAEILALLS